jgi:hypothetical protein
VETGAWNAATRDGIANRHEKKIEKQEAGMMASNGA